MIRPTPSQRPRVYSPMWIWSGGSPSRASVQLGICHLDMTRIALGIEQGRYEPISIELVLYRSQFSGAGSKFNRKLLVSLRRCGHELGQTDCAQQACTHSAHEDIALTCQDRQASPQCITCSRTASYGAVSETNPPPEPRQIFGIRDTFGKNQSSWIDASCGGFLPEIVLNRFIACNEPYHAAANAVQDFASKHQIRQG